MTDSNEKPSPISAIEAARLLAALEAAKTAASHASSEQRAASAGFGRFRGELAAVQESVRKLGTRSRDLKNSLHVLRESVDRAKLSALNAGLEGARLGEPVGKALVVMSDEQRNLLARALDALEEHSALLAEVERDRERCFGEISQMREGVSQSDGVLTRAESQSKLTVALLHELRTDFGQLFGSDPEAARAMAEAAQQVRTAAGSVLQLTQRSALDSNALRELLSPLLSLLPNREDPPR